MAHWPRVRLTTLLAARAISSRFDPWNEGGIHGLQSRHSGVGSDGAERGGGERKFRKKKREDIEREEISRCPLAAISGKLNSVREIERGNSTSFVTPSIRILFPFPLVIVTRSSVVSTFLFPRCIVDGYVEIWDGRRGKILRKESVNLWWEIVFSLGINRRI